MSVILKCVCVYYIKMRVGVYTKVCNASVASVLHNIKKCVLSMCLCVWVNVYVCSSFSLINRWEVWRSTVSHWGMLSLVSLISVAGKKSNQPGRFPDQTAKKTAGKEAAGKKTTAKKTTTTERPPPLWACSNNERRAKWLEAQHGAGAVTHCLVKKRCVSSRASIATRGLLQGKNGVMSYQ